MIQIAVIGATGYAGAELVRILLQHPRVELTYLSSRQYAGQPFAEVFPVFGGQTGLVCRDLDIEAVCSAADVVFTALPHKLPMAIAPELIRAGKKVIDLSADFRFKDLKRYEAHYQPHTAPELLHQAVYGLCELYADAIAKAALIGNPGCYPTSTLLPLAPLLKHGLIAQTPLVVDSKSGVSGAGRSVSLGTHFCEVNESFKPYKVGVHRHAPEMEEVLTREAGHEVRITFVPHLVPLTRGMQTTIYADPAPGVGLDHIRECLADHYRNRPFVRLRSHAPNTLHVKGTNFCDIGVTLDPHTGRLILMSAIDNLVKGAAGQAVQNMNLMLGLEETTGLIPPCFPL